MLLDRHARIRIESSQPASQTVGSRVVALVNRRSAATSEEAVYARVGLPAGQSLFSSGHDEISGADSGRRSETRPGVLSAAPAVTVGHRADQRSVDDVLHASA